MLFVNSKWFNLVTITTCFFYGVLIDAFDISFVPTHRCTVHHRRPIFVRHSFVTAPSETDDDNDSNIISSIDPIFDQSSVPEIPSNFNDEEKGNVNIPSTGISINDEMEAAQKDRFVTDVISINGLLPGTAAQLITTTTFSGSFEPVRYLVALSPPNNTDDTFAKKTDYVLVDIPPYSKQLVDQINEYMIMYNGQLRMIVSTNRNSIHYDEAPAIYSTRRTDLDLWCCAYPNVKIVAYRLDIPRDCRYAVTQVLDGYGPFALQENQWNDTFHFVESGRPLSVVEWDHAVSQGAFTGQPVPDDMEVETGIKGSNDDDGMYSPQAIRKREEDKRLLAIYTPGYTFGSVTYIFPESELCCSGFAIPVEDNRFDDNQGIGGSTGPALDCRGYMANSKNRKRHFESAKNLVNTYIDRFSVILPARGDPLFLDSDESERRDLLLETISQYEKIGSIYQQLGIISKEDDF